MEAAAVSVLMIVLAAVSLRLWDIVLVALISVRELVVVVVVVIV